MESLTEYLWFETKRAREIVHVTPQVREIVKAFRKASAWFRPCTSRLRFS
jgi:thiamine phosphate synthase YjbQ (UPF0047 family)